MGSLRHEEVEHDQREDGEAEVDCAEAVGGAECVRHGEGGGGAVEAGEDMGQRVEGADGEEVKTGKSRYLVVPL